MSRIWACLSCFAKFTEGKLRLSGGFEPRTEGNAHGLNCPACRSMMVHPTDGTDSPTPKGQNTQKDHTP